MNEITVSEAPTVEVNAALLQLIDEWKRQLSLQVETGELSQNTTNTYIKGWDKFWKWNAGGSVDSDVIRLWIAELKPQYSPNTINAWLAGVRHLFAWAVGNRRLFVDPTTGVKSQKRTNGGRYKHKRGVLQNGQVRTVLAQPDRDTPQGARDYAILCLKAYTGVRDVEVHRANVGDLQTKNGVMVLKIHGKGRISADDYVVLAHPDLQNALKEWLNVHPKGYEPLFNSFSKRSYGKPLSLSYLRRMVKGYITAAGIEHDPEQPITSHSFRHTSISNAIRNGAEIQKVKNFARHDDINTTLGYYHEIDRLDNPAEAFIEYNGE